MKTVRFLRGAFLSLATAGMVLPQSILAAEPTPTATPMIVDIALSDGGTLQGQLVDLQGASVSGVPVAVKTQDRDVATATTTADGRFAVKGLRGGVYKVAAGEGQGVYRLWSAGTAPPAAKNGAIVYTQGGGGAGSLKMLLSNPVVVAGVVATAVAVPVAVANSRSSSP